MRALESDFDELLSELVSRKGELKLRHFSNVNNKLKESREELQDLKLCRTIVDDINKDLKNYIKQLTNKINSDESLFSKNTTIDKFLKKA